MQVESSTLVTSAAVPLVFLVQRWAKFCIMESDGSTFDALCFSELPEEEQEQWEKFVSGPLSETNKKNTVDLVSPLPFLFCTLFQLCLFIWPLSTKGS